MPEPYCGLNCPHVASVQGAVYTYNGYDIFPPKQPTFWIAQDGIDGNPLVPMADGLSFLINEPFRVVVLARFYREVRGLLLFVLSTKYSGLMIALSCANVCRYHMSMIYRSFNGNIHYDHLIIAVA